MLKKLTTIKEKILKFIRTKKVEKLVNERYINEGNCKILKVEHFNEYDFVWIELLDYFILKGYYGTDPMKEIKKADYPFEIIVLKNGKFLEKELGVRLALRFKEYNEDYLSLEKNKENLLFLEILYNKKLGKITYIEDFEKPFNMFLSKDLTKKIENETKIFKAFFVKLDDSIKYGKHRVFLYDMNNKRFIEQLFIAKSDEDFEPKKMKNLINPIIDKYLKETTPKEEKKNPLESWNGEL